jgi:prophage tail gpP-like protein
LIKSADGHLTSKGQHNPVKVRGQNSIGHGAGALRVEAELPVDALQRLRPKVILLEGDVNDERARQRAEWQAKRAAGNSKTAQVNVIGWRDPGGQLWKRNWLVAFSNPLLFLDQDMVIKQVTLHQDGGEVSGEGTYSTLQLADPQALGGAAGKSGSDAIWKTPTGTASVRAQ